MIRDWDAKWFATGSKYAVSLVSDQKVRAYLRSKLVNAAVSRVELVRPGGNLIVTIYTGRPGIVIGKKGEDIERLRKGLMSLTGIPVQISVEEIRKPELDATLVAENICQQLEKRMMFRRAMKRAVQNSMRLGAQGVKVMVAGRLINFRAVYLRALTEVEDALAGEAAHREYLSRVRAEEKVARS